MTVETVRNSIIYDGNGVSTTFSFPFICKSKDSIVVVVYNPIKILSYGIDYTIDGLNNPSGGSVILNSPLPNGQHLLIKRHTTSKQPFEFKNKKMFYPKDFEDALDNLTLKIQEIEEALNTSTSFEAVSNMLVAEVYSRLDTLENEVQRINNTIDAIKIFIGYNPS